jgi:hypothetical protein
LFAFTSADFLFSCFITAFAGCACTYGFREQYDPATGKLLKCIPIDCSTIPGAELDAVGAGCACKQGFTQKDTADGSLACVSETQPAADDAVTATAGTWLSIPVLVRLC